MDLGLKGRVALVAASSQGIGLATAEAFAAEGCRIAMCARNKEALNAGRREDPQTVRRPKSSPRLLMSPIPTP